MPLYTPPTGTSVNFDVTSYSPASGGNVNFSMSDAQQGSSTRTGIAIFPQGQTRIEIGGVRQNSIVVGP